VVLTGGRDGGLRSSEGEAEESEAFGDHLGSATKEFDAAADRGRDDPGRDLQPAPFGYLGNDHRRAARRERFGEAAPTAGGGAPCGRRPPGRSTREAKCRSRRDEPGCRAPELRRGRCRSAPTSRRHRTSICARSELCEGRHASADVSGHDPPKESGPPRIFPERPDTSAYAADEPMPRRRSRPPGPWSPARRRTPPWPPLRGS
jgi:hypothetical protein